MSAELISSTLGLAADRWPPDHYELLGLPRGTTDAARVEAHVLDRMERLRKLQLTHPDAVTDAMNRLAQALVCLTDRTLKGQYDASLGIAPADEAVVSSVAGLSEAGPRVQGTRGPGSVTPATEDRAPPQPPSRRELYRRRVALRRLRMTWDAVGHCLADADRPFASRGELVELIQSLGVLGLLTANDATPFNAEPGRPGAMVLDLTRQPILATRLHDLSPTYRRALAGDWAAADARLRATERDLRSELAPPAFRFWRRQLRRIGRWAFVEHLDLTLVLTGLAALGVALIRAK
ncbi:MAG TPA: hypothetical protein VL371_00080 [Gemmataceae bacterium]|nr:hypothetical protein [Gemmataceae bacterium]